MNYIYIASGILKFDTGANWQFNGIETIRAYTVSSDSTKFSGEAITIKFTASYIYLGTGTAHVSGTASNIDIGYIYIVIPAAGTRLGGAAIYSFKNFQANFNYFAFGKIVLWNTGVDVEQIRYFGNVYTRFGPIISPLVNNNQPFTIN
jgi:hypothetical protein